MSILTFDIEEWFHLLDNESTKSEEDWIKYPVRIHENTDRILENLCNKNVKASFFVMGRIAEKVPEVVRKNVDYGFEIGSHTHMHQLAYEQNRFEFRNDVERSIKVLEDISGEKVRLFRAPGFLITKNKLWAFDELVSLGIEVDSSIFPVGRGHGGLPSYGS